MKRADNDLNEAFTLPVSPSCLRCLAHCVVAHSSKLYGCILHWAQVYVEP